jgi:hypothetical protein
VNCSHGNNVAGASILLVLRPAVGTLSVDDVRRRFVAALPEGVEAVYDLEPGGDYYNFFQALAALFRTYVFDLLDVARREVQPTLSWFKLPEWERLFGLATTRTARRGSVQQRQAQIQSAWRAASGQGSSTAALRAVIAPLLGYNDAADVQIIECDRTALELKHTYALVTDLAVPDNTTVTHEFAVFADGGVVSSAGARLRLVFNASDLEDWSISLTGPSGYVQTWDRGWSRPDIELFGNDFANEQINGIWTLSITNGAAADAVGSPKLLAGSSLFVEGVQSGYDANHSQQSTGGATFHWGIYADPDHLGENGSGADLAAARLMLIKMRHAYTQVSLLFSLEPYPGMTGGANAAIPGQCIPKG